jgi:hypothetical protein
VAVSLSVTVTQVSEDGTEGPVDGELAAALAGPAGRFSAMVAWAVRDAAGLDHGEREKAIEESGRELQRQLLEATLAIDSARGAGRAGHQRRGDPARQRGNRPLPLARLFGSSPAQILMIYPAAKPKAQH